VNELGKIAAFEFEKVSKEEGKELDDYSSSVSRLYNRASLISSLKPLLIFVQVDPNGAAFKSKENCEAFVTTLTTKCLENKINGIVLQAD
jgi:hypothetical protein